MKSSRYSLASSALNTIVIAVLFSSAEAADQELLDILLSNGAITEDQYEELIEKDRLIEADVAEIGFSNGSGLQIRSGDGDFEVEIGGRMQLDLTDHSIDSRMGTQPISGSQIRRGRIEIDGTFAEDWG